jgi:hypothetical protein
MGRCGVVESGRWHTVLLTQRAARWFYVVSERACATVQQQRATRHRQTSGTVKGQMVTSSVIAALPTGAVLRGNLLK